jgi:Ca2+-binding EF-hand superfamily protein
MISCPSSLCFMTPSINECATNRQSFQRADTNGDGALTWNELKDAVLPPPSSKQSSSATT